MDTTAELISFWKHVLPCSAYLAPVPIWPALHLIWYRSSRSVVPPSPCLLLLATVSTRIQYLLLAAVHILSDNRMSKFGQRQTIWSRPSGRLHPKNKHTRQITHGPIILLWSCVVAAAKVKGKDSQMLGRYNNNDDDSSRCQMGLSGFIAHTKPQNHLAYVLFVFLCDRTEEQNSLMTAPQALSYSSPDDTQPRFPFFVFS